MRKLRHVIQRLLLVRAAPGSSVFEVARLMSESRVGAVPIVDGDRLVGIFSERDLMTRVVVAGRDPHETSVAAVMTHEVVTAELDDPVQLCVERMQRAGCRHLPVLEDGRVIAMLSMRDLLQNEVAEQTEEIRGLRAYIHQETPFSG